MGTGIAGRDEVAAAAGVRVAGMGFEAAFAEGLRRSGTAVAPAKAGQRAAKARTLLAELARTADLAPGAVAEAGVWRGLTAWLMCGAIAAGDPGWRGDGMVLVDSFQGLSPATGEDAVATADGPRVARHRDNFASSVELVREVLTDFPDVDIHAGWIPPVLAELPERRYRFVHLDTDLYEPTLACLEYFAPRMVAGGIILEDDHGSALFPGPRRAWDRFARTAPGDVRTLQTGQAVWRAPAGGDRDA